MPDSSVVKDRLLIAFRKFIDHHRSLSVVLNSLSVIICPVSVAAGSLSAVTLDSSVVERSFSIGADVAENRSRVHVLHFSIPEQYAFDEWNDARSGCLPVSELRQ
ncbi:MULTISPECIES: hypothetical protein [unclassified Sporolactobacillus]|uniref:hypothetical protein n=1 Tax=unclassified Sporolactobacillus TaxID=2628533 RepID=UPI002367B595|nr:hypothetical protein [Sporolactobacillus sp. CQH2019]MDD9149942.1 hypothetical protein [Sporolactobacillus sp. CQH2019]